MEKNYLDAVKHVHFIGIGGVSMSGLAQILYTQGFIVTGSDNHQSATTDHLQTLGITVYFPNAACNIEKDVDLVVFTAAVHDDNPEFCEAKAKNIKMIDRATLLGLILTQYENSICIAGSHGKTTTTSMVAELLIAAGLDPTISIGGFMNLDGTNLRIGASSYFLLEACEYSNSFHHWNPKVGVILNIDADHLDFFKDLDDVIQSFCVYASHILPEGTLIIHEGIHGFDDVLRSAKSNVMTFGLSETSDVWANNIQYHADDNTSFDLMHGARLVSTICFNMPGEYNVLNALACYAVSVVCGIDETVACNALMTLRGVHRRFELKGYYHGTKIIDDYAHHPVEIMNCLGALRQSTNKRIVCLFQPHTYTRTKTLLDEFSVAFEDADEILFLPIFAAREPNDASISSDILASKIANKPVKSFADFNAAEDYLRNKLTENDVLVTMGAGDVYLIGNRLLK